MTPQGRLCIYMPPNYSENLLLTGLSRTAPQIPLSFHVH